MNDLKAYLEDDLEAIMASLPRSKTINLPAFYHTLKRRIPLFLNPNGEKFFQGLQNQDPTALIPWRKGPFTLQGQHIDAEWQSNLKWERLDPHLSIKNKQVLDIGCGNGYYMVQASKKAPSWLLGVDPSLLCAFQYHLIKQNYLLTNATFAWCGLEDLEAFKGHFDMILCLGILYHQRSPLDCLKRCKDLLKKTGSLMLETLILEGETPISLLPKDRYAGMPNVYFLPTVNCLKIMGERAGFKKAKVLSTTYTTPTEQRATAFSTPVSLANFLDKENPKKTTEGYPAPLRCIVELKA